MMYIPILKSFLGKAFENLGMTYIVKSKRQTQYSKIFSFEEIKKKRINELP